MPKPLISFWFTVRARGGYLCGFVVEAPSVEEATREATMYGSTVVSCEQIAA